MNKIIPDGANAYEKIMTGCLKTSELYSWIFFDRVSKFRPWNLFLIDWLTDFSQGLKVQALTL